jgi:hypothetical protein
MEQLGTLVVTALVVIIGWYVVHCFSMARDVANKQRELQVQYLIEAYRRLEYVSNREGGVTPNLVPEFERSIADVQLFGSPKQVQLAREFAKNFARDGNASLDSLLNELRNALRKELNLAPVEPGITFLRMTFEKRKDA